MVMTGTKGFGDPNGPKEDKDEPGPRDAQPPDRGPSENASVRRDEEAGNPFAIMPDGPTEDMSTQTQQEAALAQEKAKAFVAPWPKKGVV